MNWYTDLYLTFLLLLLVLLRGTLVIPTEGGAALEDVEGEAAVLENDSIHQDTMSDIDGPPERIVVHPKMVGVGSHVVEEFEVCEEGATEIEHAEALRDAPFNPALFPVQVLALETLELATGGANDLLEEPSGIMLVHISDYMRHRVHIVDVKVKDG